MWVDLDCPKGKSLLFSINFTQLHLPMFIQIWSRETVEEWNWFKDAFDQYDAVQSFTFVMIQFTTKFITFFIEWEISHYTVSRITNNCQTYQAVLFSHYVLKFRPLPLKITCKLCNRIASKHKKQCSQKRRHCSPIFGHPSLWKLSCCECNLVCVRNKASVPTPLSHRRGDKSDK